MCCGGRIFRFLYWLGTSPLTEHGWSLAIELKLLYDLEYKLSGIFERNLSERKAWASGDFVMQFFTHGSLSRTPFHHRVFKVSGGRQK